MQYWILGALWALYFFLHSAFAAERTKQFYLSRAPQIYRYYRLIYNILALINFCLLFYFQLMQPDNPRFIEANWANWAGAGLIFIGFVLMIRVLRSYDMQEFTGVSPLLGVESDGQMTLQTNGIHKYVRHPLYSAILVVLAGYFMLIPTWDTVIFESVTIVYLFIGIWFEEKKLVKTFGEAYLSYKHHTKKLIPFIL